MKVELQTTQDFVNHLRHCIQEEHGIELSAKAVRDIKETILGANRVATKGSIENVKELRTKYHEQIRTNEMLMFQAIKARCKCQNE